MVGVTTRRARSARVCIILPSAAKGTSAEAKAVDKLNIDTQASIEDMTTAVEQNAASIEEMRMTLREVAKHVENLLQTVESTSSAMTELDASVGEVERSTKERRSLPPT